MTRTTDELAFDDFSRDRLVVVAPPHHGTDTVALVKHVDVVKVEGQNRLVPFTEEAADFLCEGPVNPGPQGRYLGFVGLVTGIALRGPPPFFRGMIEGVVAAGTGPSPFRHCGSDHIFAEAGHVPL